MTVKNLMRRPEMTGPRWQEISDEPEFATGQGSFHASLLECTRMAARPEALRNQIVLSSPAAKPIMKQVEKPAPSQVVKPVADAPASAVAKASPGALARGWSWWLAQNQVKPQKRQPASPNFKVKIKLPSFSRPAQSAQHVQSARSQRPPSGLLAHVCGWVRAKYSMSVTKRLRVSEIVSLGEKRFVAVVCLEGREFLVGGGASGVSLLTQLGAPAEPAQALRSDFGARGVFE